MLGIWFFGAHLTPSGHLSLSASAALVLQLLPQPLDRLPSAFAQRLSRASSRLPPVFRLIASADPLWHLILPVCLSSLSESKLETVGGEFFSGPSFISLDNILVIIPVSLGVSQLLACGFFFYFISGQHHQ